MRAYFENVQALRGAACLLVVLTHLWIMEAGFGLQTPVLRETRWFGFLAVDLFFVISGFILTATSLDKLGRPSALPNYYARRLWRVFPTYWAAVAVVVLAFGSLNGFAVYAQANRRDWLAWLTLTPTAAPNILIGQAWTLVYEVMFYAAFGLLFLLPRRVGVVAAVAWAGVVVSHFWGPARTGPAAVPVSPFVLEFLGGCLVAWLVTRGKRYGRAALALAVVYATAGIVLTCAWSARPFGEAMGFQRSRVAVFGPPAVLIVYGFAALEGRWRTPRWLVRLGDASYSLYLLHPIVLHLSHKLGFSIPHTRLPHTLWVVGTFLATLLVAAVFYRLVERPLMSLGKRNKPRAVTPAVEPPARLAA